MITIWMMTWKEVLRKRVLLLTFLMSALFLAAFWFVAKEIAGGLEHMGSDPSDIAYILRRFELGAVILSLGFFFGSFVIAFLSIFSSFSSIAGEAEQSVMQAMLSRPISRYAWFAGRWLGYVSMGLLYALMLFSAILLITDYHAAVPTDLALLIKSFLLFALVVPLLISASLLGSCYFSTLGNGVFMTMLFGAGWLGGMIEKVTSFMPMDEDSQRPLETISGLMSLAMPADALHRRMLAELFSYQEIGAVIDLVEDLGPFALVSIPSNAFILYSVAYTLLMFGAGMLLFRRKDL